MAIDPATFRIRYPALASTSDATIAYWLTDAALTVTDTWGTDQEPATLALAAHGIAKSASSASGAIPAGVTSFRSGSFSATVTDAAANAATSAGYDSTVYGQEYLRYLRRNFGGPMLMGFVLC